MKHGKTIALVISVAANVLVFAFIAFALSAPAPHTLSFHDLGASYTTAALLVSVPLDSGSAVFGPVDITLAAGERAALQLSASVRGRQANWLLASLYDRRIIQVEATGFGVIITALEPGETAMQTVTEDGITDVAVVTVTGFPGE
jgi:hypothetical protein